MLRFVFLAILVVFIARALFKFWQGLQEGLRGQTGGHARQLSVHMVRDPMCGTFVVPERALALTVNGELLHFCSTTCRDSYVAQTTGGKVAAASRAERSEGSRA